METHNDTHVKTVSELAHEEVKRQIALMIYLIILCLSGIIGNCLVCYIYAKKNTLSTFGIFVIVLAAVDLFTCSVIIPLELLQFAWQYTYDNILVCKLNVFVKMWLTITSGFLFLCIAIDRYRRVCRPFGVQISFRAARNMCIASLVLGVAFSWTSMVMYSVQTAHLKAYNLTISECAITESVKQTLYPLISNASLVILFVGSLTAIIIMYCFIAVRIRQQMQQKIGGFCRRGDMEHLAKINNKFSSGRNDNHEGFECDTSTGVIGSYSNATEFCQETSIDKTETEGVEKYRKVTKTANTNRDHKGRDNQRRSTKTTLIMFMISLAFIISYLPLLCVRLIKFTDKTFVASLTDAERAVYKFAHRSYFLNCAVNPVIYGVCDPRFRDSCRKLFAFKQK